ncbi:MAG: STT3 domain-containing protein [Planctomycetota bacterium]|nr:STT3 domain-containing protein [Planctomycetota bacterium]
MLQTPALAVDSDKPGTGWRSWLSIPQDRFNGPWVTFLLILIAWFACALVRYQWIAWADGDDALKFLGVIQPTTHDALTHGAVLQQHIDGLHQDNPNLFPILNNQGALHALSWLFLKAIPIQIATLLVWAPVVLGSLVTVPLVLIGRLYGSALWGFTAALLGGVAWNYYERSMAGYFDTDLFSFWIALLLVFFFLGAHERRTLTYAGIAALAVFLYPFFYAKGLVIGASIAGSFIGVQVLYILFRREADQRLRMIALVAAGTAASPWSNGARIHESPWLWFLGLAAIVVIWVLLSKTMASGRTQESNLRSEKTEKAGSSSSKPALRQETTTLVIVVLCVLWLIISMPWGYFITQLETYSQFLTEGTEVVTQLDPVELKRQEIYNEINFRNTHKHTVLEAQGEAFSSLARRIMGSVTGFNLSIIGYVLLCIRYPGFLIGLPLVTLGLFSFDGGLRFTTWGSLVGSASLVYLLFIIVQALLRCLPRLTLGSRRFGSVVGGMLLATPFIAVNVTHAISFKVGTVFNQPGIAAIQSIKHASSPGDYILSWWDYGSGPWYYADRNVLMTPISASDDCWTVANIAMSDSQEVAAGLAQCAADAAILGHLPTPHHFLGLEGDSPIYPQQFLEDLKNGRADLPPMKKEVFLYFPMSMVRLLGVLEAYADPDYSLPTGPEAGVYHFLPPGSAQQVNNEEIMFANGIILNLRTLITTVHNRETGQRIPVEFKKVVHVQEDIETGRTIVRNGPTLHVPGYRVTARGGIHSEYNLIDPEGEIPKEFYWLNLLILAESGNMIMLDDEFLNSNMIQMVVMQQFDPDLWKLIHKSGYARVFQLKDRDAADDQLEIIEEPVEGPPAP